MCALLIVMWETGSMVSAPLLAQVLNPGMMEIDGPLSDLGLLVPAALLSIAACRIGFGVRVSAERGMANGLGNAQKRQIGTT
ncbi:hypothetical protein QBC34DRAFT_411547 [Podospora aff. communis PSN243]|uniref:ABC transmembrane type-1 domain-containing protein n=1 Tax=Podospora aff. communis PSN243 TaxID=3040156 RepID=A0AAV9GCZ3_9PEZI|nr:hypothetical protein QBC34DRAFT_411547 [Podospora aff. communis PSN243]